MTFLEFHFETEAKVDFPSVYIQQRYQKFEKMFSILNRALSCVIASFGNKFCLKKRSRLIKGLDNRFYVKFMQLEIGLLHRVIYRHDSFVLMLHYCASLKSIRYESLSLNRIVPDKLLRVIVDYFSLNEF